MGIDNHTDENKWNEINMGTKHSVEKLKKEIQIMNIKRREIERNIAEKQDELIFMCKHIDYSKEYDDDFNSPSYYNLCLTCGIEF